MKKVILRIDGKAYEKAEPTVKDWIDYYDAWAIHQKNLLRGARKNEAAFEMILQVISHYFSVPKSEILSGGLNEKRIERAFKDIQESLVASFRFVNLSDIQDLMDRRIIHNVMEMASEMFLKQGILPEDFFNQSLTALNRVLSHISRKMLNRVGATAVDDTNF